MKRILVVLVFFCGCGSGTSCGPSTDASDLCDFPYGVGPDNTGGECDPEAICLPTAVAPCAGDDCCHAFCVSDCGLSTPCLNLTPSQFPDSGVIAVNEGNCLCEPDAGADAGCVCDSTKCMWEACLSVCSSAT